MVAYFRPTSLPEALQIRAEREVKILAGGTDIYPARTTRAGWGEMAHPDVLDISALCALKGIETTPDHWRLGALATWSDLVAAGLPAPFDGLQRAARDIGGVQIQNRATIAGNVCNASPAADGVPCLLALDAEVELASVSGTRGMPLADFITGNRLTAARTDEIVTAILVPRCAGQSHFIKLGARRYLVISIAMVAGVIATDEENIITQARIAVGSCSAVAQRLAGLESELTGRRLAADLADTVRPHHLAHLAPIDDVRASARYRHAAALVLVRDLLRDIAGTSHRRAA